MTELYYPRRLDMKETKAFSPCHITGFFQILDQTQDVLHAGSKGAGVSLGHGVKTEVKFKKAERTSTKIMINNFVSDSAEVSEHVLDAFLIRLENAFKINVRHYVSLPIGAGFGTSGAAALSLALSLNEAFGLGMSRTKAAQIAHIAEVECKTGLGTVIAETFGGLEIRVKPGAPGIGKIKKVPISKDHIIVCLNFNSLPTKKFLTDKETRRYINKAGEKLVASLVENPEIENFMKFSRQFAEQVGVITKKIREVLDTTDKTRFVFSMPMFGESVFTLIERESLPEILKIFGRFDKEARIIVSEIDFEGARLLK